MKDEKIDLEPIIFTLISNFIGYCYTNNWTIWNLHSKPYYAESIANNSKESVYNFPVQFPLETSVLIINNGEFEFKLKDFHWKNITINEKNKQVLTIDLPKLGALNLIDTNQQSKIAFLYSPLLAFGYANQDFSMLINKPTHHLANALFERLLYRKQNPEKIIKEDGVLIKFNNSKEIFIFGNEYISSIEYKTGQFVSIIDFTRKKITLSKYHSNNIYSALKANLDGDKLVNCHIKIKGDQIECAYVK